MKEELTFVAVLPQMRADAVSGVVVFQEQAEPEQVRVLLDKLRDLHLDVVAPDGFCKNGQFQTKIILIYYSSRSHRL
jgi:hypothetical protein